MSPHEWFTLAVVVATVAALVTERISAPYVILVAVTALLAAGVVNAQQALSGFSSDTPVSIAALYVMAKAVEVTGALDPLTVRTLGRDARAPGQRRATARELVRMLAPTALISSFIYNTPTTAMLGPQVGAWAHRSRRSPSWYLMAFNAAVLLGGLVTVIGTTTNVVVSGLLQKAGQRPLSLFEMTPVGLPAAVVGIAATIALARWLLPGRQAPGDRDEAEIRQYTVEMEVTNGSLAGLTVADAGLRNLQGVYLVEISRDGQTKAPVAPVEVLTRGDRLVFAGNVGSILDLQRMPGLVSAEEGHFSVVGAGGRCFYEAVVAPGSPLAGSTLKEVGFRERHQAAVVAIHRHGERLTGKLGSVRLRAGDVLMLLASADFQHRWRDSTDFALVAPLAGTTSPRRPGAPLVWLVVAAFLAVVTTGAMPLLTISLLGALALVALRVLSIQEARTAIDLNVIVVLAGSFGLGAAMDSSGLARDLAHLLLAAVSGLGTIGVLGAVLVATVVVTQLVTNNATAILMFPVAMAAAAQAHASPRAFAIAVAVGASASFLTPIGYQTNMIVAGLGGYRFRDFFGLGSVLVVAVCAVALVAIPLAFPLHR